jgi:hypothetical protein
MELSSAEECEIPQGSQRVVARTNKYCETKVKDDVEYTHRTFLKATGARQVFTVCDTAHCK